MVKILGYKDLGDGRCNIFVSEEGRSDVVGSYVASLYRTYNGGQYDISSFGYKSLKDVKIGDVLPFRIAGRQDSKGRYFQYLIP